MTMLLRLAAIAVAIVGFAATSACERISTKLPAPMASETPVVDAPAETGEGVTAAETKNSPTYLLEVSGEQLDKYVTPRRGATKSLFTQSGLLEVATDAENDTGAYIAVPLPLDVANALAGKRVIVVLEASSDNGATLMVRFVSLPDGRSPWLSLQLNDMIEGHSVFFDFPESGSSFDGAAVFIRSDSPDSVYRLASIKIGVSD
jgi:hypothetical protein